MTIEQIMEIANAYAATAGDVVRGWVPVQHLTAAEEKLRHAVGALVAQARDEEAEACIELCQCFVRMVDSAEAIEAIRARIAARKVAP